jgi:RNA polymerase sigma factor (sigma-70 family)
MHADDMNLVREFASNGSEAAFATLVQRHVNLVYSAALRQLGNAHAAEEVAQAVFIILARKAGSLRQGTILSGWLYQTAQLTAANYHRTTIRRQRREQEAFMQFSEHSQPDVYWHRLAPLLEEAMSRLGQKERDAVVMRYFENCTVREVAAALGVREDAAQKRVNRATEKLRAYFVMRGIQVSTTALLTSIGTHAMQAAPTGLANAISAGALAKAAAASTSTLTMVKGALKLMAWARWKFAIGGCAALAVAGAVAITALSATNDSNSDDHNDRYQIDGTLTYGTTITRNFILTVNGSNWMVHLTRTQPDAPIPTDNNWPSGLGTPLKLDYKQQYDEEVGFSGSVYHYTYYGKLPPGSAGNNGNADIDYGESAVEDSSFANYVWAGLASGYYYSRNTDGQVTPVNMLTIHPRQNRVKAVCELNDTAPYLPKSIDYYNGPIQGIQLRPGVVLHQFDNGWKAGELRVQQERTINGRTFPIDYTYKQFQPNFAVDATTNNLVEHQYLVTVHVQKIRLHAVPDVLPPKLQGDTAVIDRRYLADRQSSAAIQPRRRPGQIVPDAIYFTSRGRLPTEPDVAAIKKSEQERQLR